MVDIKPFRAIRYAEATDLSDHVAPPYDVITPARQQALYDQSPHNIVRVDLNQEEAGDSEMSRYERAQAILSEWLEQGTLRQDDSPAFYVLAQTFTGPDGVERTRTGFFGRARLTRFGEGSIMPHERTLKGPKIDRLRLYRATKTNLSPIFGMYQDPEGKVLELLAAATSGPTTIEATLDGVKNRLWRVDDPAVVKRIQESLEPKKLYIADGHHRYETGLAYRDERRESADSDNPEAGYESILMFSAAVEDPGMVVFPTHRVVHSVQGFDRGRMLDALARFFATEEVPDDVQVAMTRLSEAGETTNAFLLATSQDRLLLTLRSDAPLDEVESLPQAPAVRQLDVAVLHAVILEHVLEISREAQATQTNLRYSKDNTEAFTIARSDESVQAVFLMNATRIEQVIEVSDGGEVMPQKSTFFYPKIPSGLVLYPLD